MLLLILKYVHIFNYLTFKGILLDVTIYSVIYPTPLHITQLAIHPMCLIVNTNHPIYNVFP